MASWLILIITVVCAVNSSTPGGEMALANVTRLTTGDLFSLIGTDCGPTRCMEVSHGTALAAMTGTGCVCQCRPDTPAFREDLRICVNSIDECVMASFGRGATQPQIPFVFLPLKGQIIYPSKEIVFTDVEDSICAVTSAQYLSPSGWMTLRDQVDNDVPFGLYRDEGSTFLQWRGSVALHARLEGRLVAAHVLCSAPKPTRIAASCAAFRIAGVTNNALLDVRSITFHAGETVTVEPTTQSGGLSVLESLAVGVCILMLIFVYAAGIVFYIHYKKRQKRKQRDPEINLSNTISTDNESTLDSRIDMENMRLKTNPLLKMDNIGDDYLHETALSDVSEHTEDTINSSPNNTQKKIAKVTSAMVHSRRKKPTRPTMRATSTPEKIAERLQRRSASPDTFERAPHSDLSIVDFSTENNIPSSQPQQSSGGEPVLRRKLYFNPVFFEIEHLKNPPPAAIEFLIKIREVMAIAKEKMTSKRFIPVLSDIPEEELYHTVDLGWDIPCARRGRRFSAISLKRENSRRSINCGGCPGCDTNVKEQKNIGLARSNSCKTCVSEDYKQRIVRKWLDEVPSPRPAERPMKSIAKVSGTPRAIIPKEKDNVLNLEEPLRNEETDILKITDSFIKEDLSDIRLKANITNKVNNVKINKSELKPKEDTKSAPTTAAVQPQAKNSPVNASRHIRKNLPPPPPPPVILPESSKCEEVEIIPLEIKKKMEAVIRELNECQRVEPKELEMMNIESVEPIAPKIVIPVVAADSQYYSDDNLLLDSRKRDMYMQREYRMDFDSLERNSMLKKRRFSVAGGPEIIHNESFQQLSNIHVARDRLSRSWRDVRKALDENQFASHTYSNEHEYGNRSLPISEVFINTIEPTYNNIPKPGPLTIEVRCSPIEKRRNVKEDFDPDTLDRKPRRDAKKRVDKILLKSGGSFKFKLSETESEGCMELDDSVFTRKIGSLRQIYEAKSRTQKDDNIQTSFYERRGSIPYRSEEYATVTGSIKSTELVRHVEKQKALKPPVAPKQRRGAELYAKVPLPTLVRDAHLGERSRLPEERDRIPNYSRGENLNARRSGRRSARTRSRRTDLRKLYRTEDSGYLSTDSNDSKRRANYLMQLKQKALLAEKNLPPISTATKTLPIPLESDTDDLESLCDGRSESGGESVETDSVFFGNFDDSKQIFAEFGIDGQNKITQNQEQIDSGFMGETNIILSGDSDSEHRSVISIIAGRDGRASAASIINMDDAPYINSVEC